MGRPLQYLMVQTTKPASPARYGFTLIELLVVIAILAVLAGLLLPALSRAKSKAQGVVCLNKQRQLIPGGTPYAQDNRDWLVPNNPTEMSAGDNGSGCRIDVLSLGISC